MKRDDKANIHTEKMKKYAKEFCEKSCQLMQAYLMCLLS